MSNAGANPLTSPIQAASAALGKAGLTDPRYVLRPEYRGKLGVVNPVGIASYVDLYRFYRENFGDDFVDQLAEQQPRIYPSSLGVAQALTSGEVVVSPMAGA